MQDEISYSHVLLTKSPAIDRIFACSRGAASVFPLYLYPTDDTQQQKSLFDADVVWQPDEANGGRVPNLNPEFVAEMEAKLGLEFVAQTEVWETSEVSDTFTPEDIFYYAYAVFHSPTYRQRYAEFLKIDFPRLPLTSNVDLFRSLCALGEELVALHLLESPAVNAVITSYPVAGDDRVISAHPKYTPPTDGQPGRVYINKKQYFEGVPPEVWEFQIGGYQVLHKWLKDRKKRTLSYDELEHYQKIVVALQKTMALMETIDETIPEFPIS